MKQEHFEFNELPYQTLARFGLTPVSYTHLHRAIAAGDHLGQPAGLAL